MLKRASNPEKRKKKIYINTRSLKLAIDLRQRQIFTPQTFSQQAAHEKENTKLTQAEKNLT